MEKNILIKDIRKLAIEDNGNPAMFESPLSGNKYYLQLHDNTIYIEKATQLYEKEIHLIKGIVIPQYFYYSNSLNILKHFPNTREVIVRNNNIIDCSGLKHLKALQTLNISPVEKQKINLELNCLEHLVTNRQFNQNLPQTLKSLTVQNYDLDKFILPKNLEELIISEVKYNTLDLSGFDKLQKIIIYNSKYDTFKNIKECLNLHTIELHNCSELKDLSQFSGSKQLKIFEIQGKHSITNFIPLKNITSDWYKIKFNGKNHYGNLENLHSLIKGNNELEIVLPSDIWKNRLKNGDSTYNTKGIKETAKEFSKLMDFATKKKKPTSKQFNLELQRLIITLNKIGGSINPKYGNFIETLEREEIWEFILTVSSQLNLNIDEDKLNEIREW